MNNSYEVSPESKSAFTEVYTQKRGTCVTVVVLGVIIGIFSLAYITFGNETKDDQQKVSNTLKLVNIIVHHGQTAPTYTYPTDLYGNDSRWLFSQGELSKRGKQNMFSLGKFLRERYSGFLPDLYFSSDIEVLSSNADTCLMSAAVLLAGLYPPHKFQIWNPHILWQPIPVKGITSEVDKMIDVTRSCPALVQKKQKIEAELLNDDRDNIVQLYKYLSNCTGMKIENLSLSTVLELYNLLSAQERNNLVLPEWSKSVYPKDLFKYAVKALHLETETNDVTQLSTGMLLQKITSDIIKKREDAISTKMFLYSGHEKSLLNMLRIFDREMTILLQLKPEFSSAVLIELHHIDNDTVVKAHYMDKNGKILVPVNITKCGDPCLVDDFVKFTKVLIPSNWDKACSIQDS